jgi:hypothetical protein
MEQCNGCRFWLNWDSEDTNLGECHRFPPRMATVPRTGAGQDSAVTVRPGDGGWPLTYPDDWCGEFQPVPTPAAETTPSLPDRGGDIGPAGI